MLISIIIPVYNHAHTLRQVFTSIKSQTLKEFEVVVVNDGSTDNFDEVMKGILSDQDFKNISIKVLPQENKGAPSARNYGFRESQGDYIIFWDADTIGKPEMLEKMYSALVYNKEASYVYSGFKFGWKKFLSFPYDVEKLKKMNYIDVTSLIRRDDFPGFDEGLKKFQDWDLWLTMLEQGKSGVYVPEVLYKKIVGHRQGISSWLPRFFYKLPFKTKAVKKYEEGKDIIFKKHQIEMSKPKCPMSNE